MLVEYLDDNDDPDFLPMQGWYGEEMDPETLDTFITKVRASVDTLADQLLEELQVVQEFLRDGKFDEALQKVDTMIKSIEDMEEDN